MKEVKSFCIPRDEVDFTWEVNEMNDFLKDNGFDFPREFFVRYSYEVVDKVRDGEDLTFEWYNRLDNIHDFIDEFEDEGYSEEDEDKLSKILGVYENDGKRKEWRKKFYKPVYVKNGEVIREKKVSL